MMEPVAWLVHAEFPYVTMGGPLSGGLARTPLYTADAIRAAALEEAGKDAARFRWLLARNPTVVVGTAWGVPEACAFDGTDPVAALDAAMLAQPLAT